MDVFWILIYSSNQVQHGSVHGEFHIIVFSCSFLFLILIVHYISSTKVWRVPHGCVLGPLYF